MGSGEADGNGCDAPSGDATPGLFNALASSPSVGNGEGGSWPSTDCDGALKLAMEMAFPLSACMPCDSIQSQNPSITGGLLSDGLCVVVCDETEPE